MSEEVLLGFARALRRAGIPVHLSEVMDSLQAADMVGLNSETDFFQALKCTLVKDQEYAAAFERVYRLYFGCRLKEAHKKDDLNPVFAPAVLQDQGRGSGTASGGTGIATAVVRAVKKGDREKLIELLLQAFNQEPPQSLEDLNQTRRAAMGRAGWFMARYQLQKDGFSPEKIKPWEELAETVLDRWLADSLGQKGEEALLAGLDLARTDFSLLDASQQARVAKRVERLGRKLATRRSRRLKNARHGEIDLRRTAEKALARGGIPLELARRRKAMDKPDLVLLCDVSGSVAPFAGFMLLLVYTMQRRFARVRSLVFVDRVTDVTEYFLTRPPLEAFQLAYQLAHASDSDYSHYGRVFVHFARDFSELLTPAATWLILGDARNNWQPPRDEIFKTLAQKPKQTIWLNPQPSADWDKGDSVFSLYAPYCRQVFPCANLKQLEQVAENIF